MTLWVLSSKFRLLHDKIIQEARILLIPVQRVVVAKVKLLGNINLPRLQSSNKDVRMVTEIYANYSV